MSWGDSPVPAGPWELADLPMLPDIVDPANLVPVVPTLPDGATGMNVYLDGHGPFGPFRPGEIATLPEGAAGRPEECMCARRCQLKVNLRRWCA